MTTSQIDKAHWTVDKKVPLALIFAIFLQTSGAFWWAGKVDSRITSLETTSQDVDKALTELTEIKVHMQYQRESLNAIKELLAGDK